MRLSRFTSRYTAGWRAAPLRFVCAAAIALTSAVGFAQAERVLTLAEALRIARAQSRDVAAARSRKEQADTGIQAAWSALLPTLTAQGKYTHNYKQVELDTSAFNQGVLNLAEAIRTTVNNPAEAAAVSAFQDSVRQAATAGGPVVIQPLNQLDGLAALTVPLIVPAAYYGLSAAHKTSEAAASTYDSTEATVLLQAGQAFYAVAGAQELLGARRNAVEVAKETLSVARSRLEAGVTNRVDLQRAQVALIRAQQAVLEAAELVTEAKRLLATLLNFREPFRVDPGQGPQELSTPVDELAREALRIRPEVIALERNIAALDAQAKAAGWRWSPTLSGFGNYRYFNYTGFSGDHFAWALGLQVDWLVFDGGLRDSQRYLANAERRESEYRLFLLRDQVVDEIANAQLSVETRRSALKTAEEAADLSRSTLGLIRSQYEVGTATQLDVLTAQDSLVTADVAAAQARFDLALSALALERAAGVFPASEMR